LDYARRRGGDMLKPRPYDVKNVPFRLSHSGYSAVFSVELFEFQRQIFEKINGSILREAVDLVKQASPG
jgi:hypothetical protein